MCSDSALSEEHLKEHPFSHHFINLAGHCFHLTSLLICIYTLFTPGLSLLDVYILDNAYLRAAVSKLIVIMGILGVRLRGIGVLPFDALACLRIARLRNRTCRINGMMGDSADLLVHLVFRIILLPVLDTLNKENVSVSLTLMNGGRKA